ncbi:MAG: hypothetical protein HC869_26270 [Rhodospirillales bacterium]|nr:hypothetical protein [Rhodospirillales bacterium]
MTSESSCSLEMMPDRLCHGTKRLYGIALDRIAVTQSRRGEVRETNHRAGVHPVVASLNAITAARTGGRPGFGFSIPGISSKEIHDA